MKIGFKGSTIFIHINLSNAVLAYKATMDRTISAPDLSELCGIALYGDVANR